MTPLHKALALALLVPGLALTSGCLRKANTCETDADCFSGEQCASNGVCAAPRMQGVDMGVADMRTVADMAVADMRAIADMGTSADMGEPRTLPLPPRTSFPEQAEHAALQVDARGRVDVAMVVYTTTPCVIHKRWDGGAWRSEQVLCGAQDETWRAPALWWEGEALHLIIPQTSPSAQLHHLVLAQGQWQAQTPVLVHPIPANPALAVTVDATVARATDEGVWVLQTQAAEDEPPEVVLIHKPRGGAWGTPRTLTLSGERYCPSAHFADAPEVTSALVRCVDDGDQVKIHHLRRSGESWMALGKRPPMVDTGLGTSGVFAAVVGGALWALAGGESGRLQVSTSTAPDTWSDAATLDMRALSGGTPHLIAHGADALTVVFAVGDVAAQRPWAMTSRDGGRSWGVARELRQDTNNVFFALERGPDAQAHMLLGDPQRALEYGLLDRDF